MAGWERHPLLESVPEAERPDEAEAALVDDLDGDGRPDLLAVQAESKSAAKRIHQLLNRGGGSFEARLDAAKGEGDFLQGAVALPHPGKPATRAALSWHRAGQGVQMLSRSDPSADWAMGRISDSSQDEALSAGDIDGDGDIDLLLGTRWLRNDGGAWSRFTISTERGDPDRNRLADMDGDGRLDAVVGFQAISDSGDLVWFKPGADPTMPWSRTLIARLVGPMSLDARDMDGDGDTDVVAGEHDLARPDSARLILFENLEGKGRGWRARTLYRGDEHHDGAQAADVDGDGDLDLVSIGWGHPRVLWYENPGHNRCDTGSGRPAAAP